MQQYFLNGNLHVHRGCGETCDVRQLDGLKGVRSIHCCKQDLCNRWDAVLAFEPPVQKRYTCKSRLNYHGCYVSDAYTIVNP